MLCSARVVLKYPISPIPQLERIIDVRSNFCHKQVKMFHNIKNKIKIFWGWKPSKNKSIKPHHSYTSSYLKKCKSVKYVGKVIFATTKTIGSQRAEIALRTQSYNLRCSFFRKTSINTARFLKNVWPFFNIMHERV